MADEATEEVNIATIFENIETTMVDIMTPLNALIGRHHIEFGSLHHRKRIACGSIKVIFLTPDPVRR